MKTYLPRQHSCCRESDGIEPARGMPTLSRGVHCTSSWPENAPGHCGYHQPHGQVLTSTVSGPLCPTSSQTKTRCHPTWDNNAQRNPRKTLAKVKGMSRGRSAECSCAHNWHEPVQFGALFPGHIVALQHWTETRLFILVDFFGSCTCGVKLRASPAPIIVNTDTLDTIPY
ncbi:hypothetical protein L345_14423, partial [Ophiophagus hannah]